jgi:hypothetical protein
VYEKPKHHRLRPSQLKKEFQRTEILDDLALTWVFTNMRLITHAGMTTSPMEWSLNLGGNPNLIQERLKKGMTEHEALTTPVEPSERCRELATVDGEPVSLAYAAQVYDIPLAALMRRLERGWTVAQALNQPVAKTFGKNRKSKNAWTEVVSEPVVGPRRRRAGSSRRAEGVAEAKAARAAAVQRRIVRAAAAGARQRCLVLRLRKRQDA